jgi:ribosomal-protein-alanine acetyltransferase
MIDTLRPMTPADLDEVDRLARAATPDPWSRALLDDEFADGGPERVWLVATGPAGRIEGFGGVLLLAGDAHVMNLVVDTGRRRRGIGARLLTALLAAAVERGAAAATLEVRAGNDGARTLYRRHGFHEAGRRPRYYPDGEDAVILWRHHLTEEHGDG